MSAATAAEGLVGWCTCTSLGLQKAMQEGYKGPALQNATMHRPHNGLGMRNPGIPTPVQMMKAGDSSGEAGSLSGRASVWHCVGTVHINEPGEALGRVGGCA